MKLIPHWVFVAAKFQGNLFFCLFRLNCLTVHGLLVYTLF